MRGLLLPAAMTVACAVASPAVAATSNDVLIALQIGSAAADQATIRAGAEIARQREQLIRTEKQKRTALQQLGLAESMKRALRAELTSVQANIRSLLDTLAAKDEEFSISLTAYREGLENLLATSDPRISAAFERYANGDESALDEVQEITRISAKASAAGAKARIKYEGDRLRYLATVVVDARDKGIRTTQQVLAAWQDAADVDPVNVDQWRQIARLQIELGNEEAVQAALKEALSAATTDYQRATVYLQYASGAHGRPAGLPNNLTPTEGALEIFQRLAKASPNNPLIRLQILSTLDAIAFEQSNKITKTVMNGQPADAVILEPTRKLLGGATDIATSLLQSFPDDDDVQRTAWIHFRRSGELAVAQRRYDDAAADYEKATTIATSRLSRRANDPRLKQDEVTSLRDTATLKSLNGDDAGALNAFKVAAKISEALWAADQANTLKHHDAWISYTDIGLLGEGMADYQSALDGYQQALRIGQASAGIHAVSYMVSLTLPRIANVQGNLGNFEAAEKALADNAAFRSKPGQPDMEQRQLSALQDLVALSDVAYKAKRYALAVKRLNTLREELSIAKPDGEASQRDLDIMIVMAEGRQGDVFVEAGDIAGAQAAYKRTVSKLGQMVTLDPTDAEAKLLQISMRMTILDYSGSVDGWSEAIAELEAIKSRPDLRNVRRDYVHKALQLARMRAARPITLALQGIERTVASLKASLAEAREYDTIEPGDGFFASAASYYFIALAKIPGSGVSWKDAADYFRVMQSRHLIGPYLDRRTNMALALLRERQAGIPKSSH